MPDYAKLSLLRYRWVEQTMNLREMTSIIKGNADWHKTETYKIMMKALRPLLIEAKPVQRDLRGAPLSGADLSKAKLSGADLLKANLSDAFLKEANLSEANLWEADLSKAQLKGANLSRANLWGANLSGADLVEANLSGANLSETNLSGADLWKANLSGAILREANLSGTNLWESNLSGADLTGILYTTDEVFNRLMKWWVPTILYRIPFLNRLKGLQNLKKVGRTNFGGIDTTKMNGSKNSVLKRYIEDYQFIEGFKKKSRFHRWVIYPLWKGTSDCGRSLLLWLIWSLGFIAFFTVVYYHHRNDWSYNASWNWFYVWYLSVMKFMTLGSEHVTPRMTHPTAQIWMMAEVVIGYLMLAGLISILVNKLARRA